MNISFAKHKPTITVAIRREKHNKKLKENKLNIYIRYKKKTTDEAKDKQMSLYFLCVSMYLLVNDKSTILDILIISLDIHTIRATVIMYVKSRCRSRHHFQTITTMFALKKRTKLFLKFTNDFHNHNNFQTTVFWKLKGHGSK